MYFVIPGESLTNPLLLNDLKVVGLDVVQRPVQSNFPYWYEFVVEAGPETVAKIQEVLKPDWYNAMFSDTALTIIFHDKTFEVIQDGSPTDDAVSAREYARTIGMQPEFTDWQERWRVYLGKVTT